jgi:methylated-DNA-[protein]-cysteine S-methyltransferase
MKRKSALTEQIFTLERIDTPTGTMLVVSDTKLRLRALDWEDHEGRMLKLLQRYSGPVGVRLENAARPTEFTHALEMYFEGDIAALTDLPIATGGTEFQRVVWDALRSIPAGKTLSYGALAAKIGRPSATRAVGLANGANPIAIVVPCHRVIGADSSLTGYGGGIERKRWLLHHERKHISKGRAPSN